ncbi:hypothetical protein [Microvirga terrestris]|uniref:Uncharacterized protein n=1 Tax=Microvirga terrestris TaxID=2791024 RepID=A0ABS0HT15_9HYPH|nr:hypothetical protein [Microvirga terrestris]MBF9196340.1 hypothetical protein [Microvirga terrestris]
MTIFDPISGRQITIDLSGKRYQTVIRQECFTGGEQQVRSDQASGAEGLKSPGLPSRKPTRKRFEA